jgi:hypothetical protein
VINVGPWAGFNLEQISHQINFDLHVRGYDMVFSCSVQCILPYEFPVDIIQFQDLRIHFMVGLHSVLFSCRCM